MNAINRIEKEQLRNLLGKGWLSHDGMWFYHCYQQFGIEQTNALNRAAIRSLAPIEIGRVKDILGIGKGEITSFADLGDFMLDALEMILPDSVFDKFHITTSSNNIIHWKWESGQCFAYKGMQQIGIIDRYRCGVIYRIECWLDALGIEYSINPRIDTCIMNEKGACFGDIQVEFRH
jgi:hypothetical protein